MRRDSASWLSTTNWIRFSATALVTALLTGCQAAPAGPVLSAPPEPADPAPTVGPLSAFELIPDTATVATLTDFERIRVRFGVPDLDSTDLRADRSAFWERAATDAVLLTEGMFREDNSLWELDYGFTQDDVDWEIRFRGEDTAGWAVGFRPDLDLSGVRRALADAAEDTSPADPARLLDGAHLDGHVLEYATAFAGSWADEWTDGVGWGHLTSVGAESAYLRKGCVPVADALGDAPVDSPAYEHVVFAAPGFDRLDAWSVSYADGLLTALLGLRRDDVIARTDLGEDWPRTGPISFADAFERPLDDPGAGRIGYRVKDGLAAASVTLAEELPFAICDQSIPIVEPAGL